MFSNRSHWLFTKEKTHFKIHSDWNNPEIPRWVLKNNKFGITIMIQPERILFEPFAIDDDYCSIKFLLSPPHSNLLYQTLKNNDVKWHKCNESEVEIILNIHDLLQIKKNIFIV